MIFIGTDSHTTTHGAYGCFSTGVGATDMAGILYTGEMWLKVPEVIRIIINGEPAEKVMAKDVMFILFLKWVLMLFYFYTCFISCC